MTFEYDPIATTERQQELTERVHEFLLNEMDEPTDAVTVFAVPGRNRVEIELK